jgi:hypothetical protein
MNYKNNKDLETLVVDTEFVRLVKMTIFHSSNSLKFITFIKQSDLSEFC